MSCVLAQAMASRLGGTRALVVPTANAAEAALEEGQAVWGAHTLKDMLAVSGDSENWADQKRSRLTPFDPITPWLKGSGSAHAVQFVLQRSAASLVTAGGDPEVIAGAVWDRSMALYSIVSSFGKRLRSLFPHCFGI